MGLFDQMKNQVVGNMIANAVPGGTNPMVRAAISLIMANGGIGGLQQRFQNQGLGSQFDSWVGRGNNMPIDGRQLEGVFGRDQIEQVSRESGMPANDMMSQLSGFLPSLVDRVTPDGAMPSQGISNDNLLTSAMSMFGQRGH